MYQRMNTPEYQKILLLPLTVVILAIQYLLTLIISVITILFSYILPDVILSFLLKCWGHSIFLAMGKRIYIQGKENIAKGEKYLLVCNHGSLYDIPAIMAVFPKVAWLGREYLTRIPIFGLALKRTHYVAIPRNPGRNIRAILQKSIAHGQSKMIAMFPEGTRTTTGNLSEFKRGFVHIYNNTNLTILPVTLNGLFCLRPKTRFVINPFCKIIIIIHKPIDRKELIGLTTNEIINRVKNTMASQYKFE